MINRFSVITLAAILIVVCGISFLAGAQYSYVTHRQGALTTGLTKEVVIYPEVVYYASSTCTTAPQTTSQNSTVYIIPRGSGYYISNVTLLTTTLSNTTVTVIESISYCFTYGTTK
ncbi:MAG TPA: hypothetical protein VJN71_08300 [Nitrososphaerales archaeon]|nr:hypothetical protein [Nitrososphaerales archaeon]